MPKKIEIIGGLGFVGRAMHGFFKDRYETVILDLGQDTPRRQDADVSVVCVPTPQCENGRCDTRIVEEVVRSCRSDLIILKSTVEPGTTDRLRKDTGKRIVFSPEYCGESSYWSPYRWDREVRECPFFIFGGDPCDTSRAVDLYLSVAGPAKKYIQTSAKAAEMAKYVENSFYATKICFAYEIASVCRRAGLDYNEVRELWLLDPRVGPMHTAVFPENEKPFGGKCLPKDTRALVEYARSELGYSAELLMEVLASNERIGEQRFHASFDCP